MALPHWLPRSVLQGRAASWPWLPPINLLDNARLVDCLRNLPYQSGRPLSPIGEEEVGDIALVDYSTTHSTSDHQVYVSIHGDDSALSSQANRYANENLNQKSEDELSVNAPQDESQQDNDNRRCKNCCHATHRRNTTSRAQCAPKPYGPRNLRIDFDETAGPAFSSPVVNLAEAAILMQGLPNTPEIHKIQQLTREALH